MSENETTEATRHAPDPDIAGDPNVAGDPNIAEDLLVEEVSIDGMCGVY